MPSDPQRVQAAFLGALERPAADRPALLDQECGADGELRRRVEALLKAHDEAGSFLEEPATNPAFTSDPEPTATADEGEPGAGAPEEVVGSRIGPYKVLQQLGEGGMGVVYLAEQEQPIKRRVALKVIKAGLDSRRVIARFEAERQALALMDHPNIAKVLDAGTTSAGRPYFVMELVNGIPITKFCDQEHLTPKERLELFMPVCQAVQHAHQKGVIHRDIKPSNVLVALYDGRPVAKVIDFGVAKATQQKLTERTIFTEVGALVGTLEYMAPEQAELNSGDVDTRADVYSLGALLYELLTGSPPFTRKQLRGMEFDEMRRIIREVEPPKPSTNLSSSEELPSIAAKRKLEPQGLYKLVRGELDWIVMKALAKERDRRYETASAFAMDIQHYLHDEPVLAGPPSTGYRLRKLACKNKRLIATAVTIALLLVVGLVVSSTAAVRFQRLAEERNAKRIEAEEAKTEAEEAREQAQRARKETERQLRMATSLRLAAQSQSIQKELPVQSLLLAVEAVETTRRQSDPLLPIAHESLRSALALVAGRPLSGHVRGIRSVMISADGHWLATADDKTVHVWNLDAKDPAGRAVHVLRLEAGITATAMSADGHWLVTGCGDKVVRLWDLRSADPAGKPLVLRGRKDSIHCVAIDPKGRWVAAAGLGWTTVLWDLRPKGATTTAHSLEGDKIGRSVGLHQILSLAFSPDGRWLLAGSGNYTARLWDLSAGNPGATARVLRGHERGIGRVAFSPDGRWAITASYDKTVRLWDLTAKDPALAPRILHAGHGIYTMTVSSDGHWLATGGPDKTVRLWDLRTDDLAAKHVFRGHEDSIHSLAISSDSRWLVTGSSDRTARLWDLSANDPQATVRVLRGHEGHIDSVAIDRNRRWLATASVRDPIPRLWDLTSEDPAETDIVLRSRGQLFSMEMSRNGRWLVARFSDDEGLRLWDLAARDRASTVRVLRGHKGPGIWVVGFSPESRWLATAGDDNTVRLWDLTAADPVAAVSVLDGIQLRGNARAFALSPDGHWLAAASDPRRPGPGSVRIWDLTAADPARTEKVLRGHSGPVQSAAFSPDGRWLATGSTDGIRIWDLTAKNPPHRSIALPGQKGGLLSVAFSPNGRWLFARVVGGNTSIQVSPREWIGSSRLFSQLLNVNTETGAARPVLLSGYEHANQLMFDEAFSPDSRWLVTRTHVIPQAPKERDQEAVVQLWDLGSETPEVSGRLLFTGRHSSRVWVFSPDSHWLVTEGTGGEAQLWDLTAKKPGHAARVLRGHHAVSAAFSSDSKWLATAGVDGTTRLWDLSTENSATAAAVLRGHAGSVRSVAISPDRRWLITGSDDGTVRLRHLRIDALIDLAKQRAGRGLTDDERQKYYLP
jgi:eukaryotic-like serine/threonine-protein kinase